MEFGQFTALFKLMNYSRFTIELRQVFLSMKVFHPRIYVSFLFTIIHRHNQNPVGTFLGTSLLWSTDMKTAITFVDNRILLPKHKNH